MQNHLLPQPVVAPRGQRSRAFPAPHHRLLIAHSSNTNTLRMQSLCRHQVRKCFSEESPVSEQQINHTFCVRKSTLVSSPRMCDKQAMHVLGMGYPQTPKRHYPLKIGEPWQSFPPRTPKHETVLTSKQRPDKLEAKIKKILSYGVGCIVDDVHHHHDVKLQRFVIAQALTRLRGVV